MCVFCVFVSFCYFSLSCFTHLRLVVVNNESNIGDLLLSHSLSLFLCFLLFSLPLGPPSLPATFTSYAILLHSTNINLCIIFSMTNQSKPVRKFNRVIYFCLLAPNCFDVILQIFYTYTPFLANTIYLHFDLVPFQVKFIFYWESRASLDRKESIMNIGNSMN